MIKPSATKVRDLIFENSIPTETPFAAQRKRIFLTDEFSAKLT
jgi:hypothetical protein